MSILAIQSRIERELDCLVISFERVSGGDINEAFHIHTNTGADFFVKSNAYPSGHKMLETEEIALRYINATNTIRVPKPVSAGSEGNTNFLILEFITEGQRTEAFWDHFAHSLAELHRCSQAEFGFHSSNYIATIPQKNLSKWEWKDFYLDCRLIPLAELCNERGLLSTKDRRRVESLRYVVQDVCPEEKAALIHGDLWGGNFLCDIRGTAILIDPSISYSHREMDLGMSRLFGGFSQRFYDAYTEVFPLERGFEERSDLYQLYYLLVHLLLFGTSYHTRVHNILNRYTQY